MSRRPPAFKPVFEFRLRFSFPDRSIERSRRIIKHLFPTAKNWDGRAVFHLRNGDTVVANVTCITHYSTKQESPLTHYGGCIVNYHSEEKS